MTQGTRDWYVGEFYSTPEGPFCKYEAEIIARDRSKTVDSGLYVVYFSNSDAILLADAVFLRGRKLYQGKRARDAVRFDLPPRK